MTKRTTIRPGSVAKQTAPRESLVGPAASRCNQPPPARGKVTSARQQQTLVWLAIIVLVFSATLQHSACQQDAAAQFDKLPTNPVERLVAAPLKAPSDAPADAATPQLLPPTATTTTTSTTTLETTTEALSEQFLDEDSICSLKTVSRRSHLSPVGNSVARPAKLVASLRNQVALTERALVCAHVDEYNYRQVVKSIYNFKNKSLHLQQLHITSSESLVVLSAVDLICERFNCSKLTVFNVSGQEIPETNVVRNWLSNWPHLEVLDLSNSSLKSIESILVNQTGGLVGNNLTSQAANQLVLKNLTHLHLEDNEISSLNLSFLFERLPNLKQVSLINNSIFNIYCDESSRPRLRTQLESLSLAGNAINCDKSHLWFIKHIVVSQHTNLKFPDFEKINCSLPERFVEMTWSQRVSVLETRICDSCDCRSLKRTAISVDCHNKSLKVLPDVLPLNTKILNLTSNQIDSLAVPQNSRNWENVTYVYLEDNRISSIQPLEINSKFMRNLAALDIRRNKFQEFPSHIFEQFVNLDQVHLSDNPWLCDCDSTFAFQEWLQRQFQKVGDKEEIRCGVSGNEENGLKSDSKQQRLSSRVIYRLSKSELCPQTNLKEPYDWLDIVNIVLGITIVLIIAKLVLDYIYQHRTKRLPHFFKLNL